MPERYLEDFFMARRRFVERILRARSMEELETEVLRVANLLAPTIATCGPAGVNAAPFMVSFLVKEEYLGEVLDRMREFRKKYWGKGMKARIEAAKLLLETVYDPEKADPLRLVTHLMVKGHTWINVIATGEATISILIPPDKGAYELRAKASVHENGPIYEYANLMHDLMHGIPEGRPAHEWYPALLLEIKEIYDNSYQALGKKIFP